MKNIQTTVITNTNSEKFDHELATLLNEVSDASVQYRTTATSSGRVVHSALVIHYTAEEGIHDQIN